MVQAVENVTITWRQFLFSFSFSFEAKDSRKIFHFSLNKRAKTSWPTSNALIASKYLDFSRFWIVWWWWWCDDDDDNGDDAIDQRQFLSMCKIMQCEIARSSAFLEIANQITIFSKGMQESKIRSVSRLIYMHYFSTKKDTFWIYEKRQKLCHQKTGVASNGKIFMYV